MLSNKLSYSSRNELAPLILWRKTSAKIRKIILLSALFGLFLGIASQDLQIDSGDVVFIQKDLNPLSATNNPIYGNLVNNSEFTSSINMDNWTSAVGNDGSETVTYYSANGTVKMYLGNNQPNKNNADTGDYAYIEQTLPPYFFTNSWNTTYLIQFQYRFDITAGKSSNGGGVTTTVRSKVFVGANDLGPFANYSATGTTVRSAYTTNLKTNTTTYSLLVPPDKYSVNSTIRIRIEADSLGQYQSAFLYLYSVRVYANYTYTQDPNIDATSDFSYQYGQGAAEKISWTIYDYCTNTRNFQVFRNGTQIQSGSWTNATPIETAIGGLNVGSYLFTIIATDGLGGNSSKNVTITVLPVPPSAPNNLIGIKNPNNISLSWSHPSENGGLPITNYTIFRGLSSGTKTLLTITQNVTQYYDTTGTPGNTYYYHIRAFNSVEEGANSTDTIVVYNFPPSVPQNLQLTPGNQNITLTWNTPSSTNGAAITGYTIYRGEMSGMLNVTITLGVVLTYIDTGIVNGKEYFYQITANNSEGESVRTSELSSIPRTIPNAPTGLYVISENQKNTLYWSAPLNNGGSSVIDYTIYAGTVSGSEANISVVTAPTTNYEHTSLINGQNYYYVVVARNIAGIGTNSSRVSGIPVTNPSAPGNFIATYGNQNVTLNWTVPSDTGGLPITGYTLYWAQIPSADVNFIVLGNVTSFIHTGLTNGQNYYYKVYATNEGGKNSTNTTVMSAIPKTIPGAPTNLQANAGNGYIYLTWNAAPNGGSSITNYLIYAGTEANAEPLYTTIGNVLYYNVSGLSVYETWYFVVRAQNSEGLGPNSSRVNAIPYTPPSVPRDLTLTPSNGEIMLAWLTPLINGGSAITNYSIYRGENTETAVYLTTTNGPVLSFIDSGLTNGFTYYYRIAAINIYGEGSKTDIVSSVPRTVPSAPSNLVAIRGNTFVTLNWDLPASDGGSSVINYTVYFGSSSGGLSFYLNVTPPERTIEITGLSNGNPYYFAVSATNIAGESLKTTEVSCIPATVPTAPQNFVGMDGNAMVTLSWTAPTSTGGMPILNYSIYKANETHPDFIWLVNVSSSSFSYIDYNVENLKEYYYRIHAINDVGYGENATDVTAHPANLYPSEPLTVQAEGFDGYINLNWVLPTNNGSSDILHYRIYRGLTANTLAWIANTSELIEFFKDDNNTNNLTNGIMYFYKITAVNLDYREGSFSEVVNATPYGLPFAPQNLIATAGNNQIELSWTAPENTGGSPILSYRIYRDQSPGPVGVLTNTGSTAVTFLDTTVSNGQIYYYRVAAVTAIGVGAPSSDAYATPRTTPSAVQSLTAIPGNEHINLTWAVPLNNGGNAITFYHIFGGLVLGSELYLGTVPANQRNFTIGSLTNGLMYYFIVVAENDAGNGTNSSVVSAYPRTVPNAPTDIQITEGNGQLILQWTAPSEKGGAIILYYKVYRGSSYGTIAFYTNTPDNNTQFTDTGVSNGITYYYNISAVNIAGESPLSLGNFGMPKTTPSSPQNLRVTEVGNQNLSIAWNVPSSNGGTPILHYAIYSSFLFAGPYILITTVEGEASTTYTNTSLTNGQIYYLKIKAVNIVGESLFSNTINATPRTIPGAPLNPNAAYGNESILLTWDVPSTNGGANITNYTIFAGTDSGAEIHIATLPANQLYYNHTGLTNGIPYYYIIAAVNIAGNGTNSTRVSNTPKTLPGVPLNLVATAGNTQVSLEWSAPASGGSDITHYRIYRNTIQGMPVVLTDTLDASTSYSDTDLTNGQRYFYFVTAVNLIGESLFSKEVNATPATVPSAPKFLTAISGDSHVNLTWQKPDNNNGAAITNYTIYRYTSPGENLRIYQLENVTFYSDNNDIVNGLTYYYNITANNSVGESTYSNEVSAFPASDVPTEPMNLSVQHGNGYIILTWDVPTYLGAEGDYILYYGIYRSTTSNTQTFLNITIGNVTTYTDYGLTNGVEYYYRVLARNTKEKNSSLSNENSTIPYTVPNAPTSIITRYGNGEINISWVAPVDNGGNAITGYNVYRSVNDESNFIKIASLGLVTSYLDTTTTNGIKYYYRVSANNSAGEGYPSEYGYNISRTIPTVPINLIAIYGNANITLWWNASLSDGGTSILSYNIYRGTAPGSEIFIANTGNNYSNYTVTGLMNGQIYYFKVSAVNSEGEGPLSESVSETPKTTPDAPINFALDNGDGQILLTWDPPLSNGGAAITNYHIYRGNQTNQLSLIITVGNVSSYLDTGLVNDQTYYYLIAAVNIVGNGTNTTELSAMPLSSVPTEPQNFNLIYGNNQVNLTWNAPGYYGAPSILYYRIYRGTTKGFENFLLNTTDSSTEYSDLFVENGITYFYRISAVNSYYIEGIKTTSLEIMPRSVPTAPMNVSASYGNQNVTLKWDAPEDNGGIAISNYSIYIGTVSGSHILNVTTSGPVGEYTISSLTNGITYFFIIRARNSEGLSPNSTEVSATPKTVPTAPKFPFATPGDSQVSLSWSTPDSNGGSSITNYRIYRRMNGGTSSLLVTIGTNTLFTDFDVLNGNLYEYNITAINSAGESPASVLVSATPRTIPNAPQNPTCIFGDRQIQLNWDAPSTNGGAAILFYRIYRGTSLGTETYLINTTGSIRTYIDSGLTNGQDYYYYITAVNEAGESEPSDECHETPRTVPTAPLSLNATAGNANVNLTWLEPLSNGGNALLGYNIYRKTETSEYEILFTLDQNNYTKIDTYAENGILYFYVITAFNEIGESPISNEVYARPLTNPTVPQFVNATRGNGQILLNWTAPTSNGGLYIANYSIYRGLTSGSETLLITLENNETSYLDTVLLNGQTYYYKISATNLGGKESFNSSEVSAIPATIPSAPTITNIEAGHLHINLTWTAPTNNGGSDIIAYTIYRGVEPNNLEIIDTVGIIYFYQDTSLTNNQIYYYNITANNSVGESAHSNQVSATPQASLPSSPTNLQATTGNNSVTLTWLLPASNGTGEIVNYSIYRGLSSGSEVWIANASGYSLEFTDTTVVNGILYYYRITAINEEFKEGPYSSEVSAKPKWLPYAPTLTSVVGGNGSVYLTWDAAYPNGDTILYYRIYRGTSSNGEVFLLNTLNNATFYNDTSVSNGVQYFYNISAVNNIGEGPRSNELFATPKTTPTAPRNIATTAGNHQINLTWLAPLSNGGSSILNYSIYMGTTSGAETWIANVSTSQTSYLKMGLTNGIVYYFVVSAVNDVGYGENSTRVSNYSRTVPSTPSDLIAIGGNAIVNLTWTIPDNGGSPITKYNLYRGTTPGSIALYLTIDPTNTYVDTGLINGQTYYYRISAINIAGESVLTSSVSAIPITNPSAVLYPNTTRGDKTVTLNWTVPSNNGGLYIIHYRIYRGTESGVLSFYTNTTGNLTHYIDDNETNVNGITYYYQISAVNYLYKEGALSVEIFGKPATVPTAPQNFEISEGNNQIELTWDSPSNDGGEPITHYSIYRGDSPDVFVFYCLLGNVSYYLDSNVLNGQPYYYRIHAINVVGNGSNSSELSGTPTTGLPSAPQNLGALASPGSIALTWDAPQFNGTSDLLYYSIYRGTVSGGLAWVVNTSDLTREYLDTNVVNGIRYYYQVSAVNSLGEGGRSNEISGLPLNISSIPLNFNAIGQNGSVYLNWSVPVNNGGSAILGYNLYRSTVSGPKSLLVALGNVTTYTDTWVSNGQTYYYQISAINSVGESLNATEIMAIPRTIPGQPTGLVAIAGDLTVSLSWLAPNDNGGASITNYKIYRNATLIATINNVLNYVDYSVLNSVEYVYNVSAVNIVGEGPVSATATAIPLGEAGAPQNFASSLGNQRVTLTWSAPIDLGGRILIGYNLYRSTTYGVEILLISLADTENEYIDTNVLNGITYYYNLRAVTNEPGNSTDILSCVPNLYFTLNIKDPAGNNVNTANVSLYELTSPYRILSGLTNSNGNVTFSGLNNSNWKIIARVTQFEVVYVILNRSSYAINTQNYYLYASIMANLTNRILILNDLQNQPISNAIVNFTSQLYPSISYQVISDANGECTIREIFNGSWRLRIDYSIGSANYQFILNNTLININTNAAMQQILVKVNLTAVSFNILDDALNYPYSGMGNANLTLQSTLTGENLTSFYSNQYGVINVRLPVGIFNFSVQYQNKIRNFVFQGKSQDQDQTQMLSIIGNSLLDVYNLSVYITEKYTTLTYEEILFDKQTWPHSLQTTILPYQFGMYINDSASIVIYWKDMYKLEPPYGIQNDSISDWYSWTLTFNGQIIDNNTQSPYRVLPKDGQQGNYSWTFNSTNYGLIGLYTLTLNMAQPTYQSAEITLLFEVKNFTTSLTRLTPDNQLIVNWNNSLLIQVNYTSVLPRIDNISNANLYWVINGYTSPQLLQNIDSTGKYLINWTADIPVGVYTVVVYGNQTHYAFRSIQFLIQIIAQNTILSVTLTPDQSIGSTIIKVAYGENWTLTAAYTNSLLQGIVGSTLFVYLDNVLIEERYALGDGSWIVTRYANKSAVGTHELRIVAAKTGFTPRTYYVTLIIKSDWITTIDIQAPPSSAVWGEVIDFEISYIASDNPRNFALTEGNITSLRITYIFNGQLYPFLALNQTQLGSIWNWTALGGGYYRIQFDGRFLNMTQPTLFFFEVTIEQALYQTGILSTYSYVSPIGTKITIASPFITTETNFANLDIDLGTQFYVFAYYDVAQPSNALDGRDIDNALVTYTLYNQTSSAVLTTGIMQWNGNGEYYVLLNALVLGEYRIEIIAQSMNYSIAIRSFIYRVKSDIQYNVNILSSIQTTSSLITVAKNELIVFNITITQSGLTYPTVSVLIDGSAVLSSYFPTTNGILYEFSMNSSALSVGSHMIEIRVSQAQFVTSSKSFNLNVLDSWPTSGEIALQSKLLNKWGEIISVLVYYSGTAFPRDNALNAGIITQIRFYTLNNMQQLTQKILNLDTFGVNWGFTNLDDDPEYGFGYYNIWISTKVLNLTERAAFYLEISIFQMYYDSITLMTYFWLDPLPTRIDSVDIQRTMNIEIDKNVSYNFTYLVDDSNSIFNGMLISNATVTYQIMRVNDSVIVETGSLNALGNGAYQLSFNSGNQSGEFIVTVYANILNHTNSSKSFGLSIAFDRLIGSVTIPAEFRLSSTSIKTSIFENVTFMINITNLLPDGMVTVMNKSQNVLNYLSLDPSGQYLFSMNASELGVGYHELIVRAQKQNFISFVFNISVEIIESWETVAELTQPPALLPWDSNLTFTFKYYGQEYPRFDQKLPNATITNLTISIKRNNSVELLATLSILELGSIWGWNYIPSSTDHGVYLVWINTSFFAVDETSLFFATATIITAKYSTAQITPFFWIRPVNTVVTFTSNITTNVLQEGIYLAPDQIMELQLGYKVIDLESIYHGIMINTASVTYQIYSLDSQSVVASGSLNRIGDGLYNLVIVGSENGNYTIMISVIYQNFTGHSYNISMVIEPRQIQLDLLTQLASAPVNIARDTSITIIINATDFRTGKAITNGTMYFWIGQERFAAVESSEFPGQYQIVLTPEMLRKMPQGQVYQLRCSIEKENFETHNFDLYINIGLQVDPIFKVPYRYWMISLVSIAGFIAVIGGYRAYRYIKTPVFVRKVNKVQKIISKKKVLSVTHIVPTTEKWLLTQFGQEWKAFGLDLASKLNVKNINLEEEDI
jgi:fibronectin type 3 domain-containing protein